MSITGRASRTALPGGRVIFRFRNQGQAISQASAAVGDIRKPNRIEFASAIDADFGFKGGAGRSVRPVLGVGLH